VHHNPALHPTHRYLQKGFEDLQKSNYEFYEFIESNYYDLEERLNRLERKEDKIP